MKTVVKIDIGRCIFNKDVSEVDCVIHVFIIQRICRLDLSNAIILF